MTTGDSDAPLAVTVDSDFRHLKMRYPWNGSITYQAESFDRVRVEDGADWGVFTRDARWLEGPLRIADPAFCRWVTGSCAHIFLKSVLFSKG